LQTPVLGIKNYLDHIERFAHDHLGFDLLDWQRLAIAGATDRSEAGDLMHRTALISCSRQQGKSWLLKATMGAWLTSIAAERGEPQTCLSTAHDLQLAHRLFEDLAPVLEAKFGAKCKWAYGRVEAKLADGSHWLVRAGTPGAAHGLSINGLLIADEIWDIKDEVISGAMMPTLRAHKNALFLMASTAGTEASTAFLRFREQGLRQIDKAEQGRLYMAEWSLPPDVDPMCETYWTWSNPSMGFTGLDLDTLRAEAENPNRAEFLRASLNLWVATDRGWLQPGQWENCESTKPAPVGGWLVIDSSLDEGRFVGLRCVMDDEQQIHVEVAFNTDTLTKCVAEVDRLMDSTPLNLAVTPTLEPHMTTWKTRLTLWGYNELLKFTPLVRGMIVEGRISHRGEVTLNEHVSRAVAVKSQGGMALSSQRSPGPIELARCLVAGVAYASRPVVKRRVMSAHSR